MSHCHNVSLSQCLIVTMPHCHRAWLSQSLIVTMPDCHRASLSQCLIVTNALSKIIYELRKPNVSFLPKFEFSIHKKNLQWISKNPYFSAFPFFDLFNCGLVASSITNVFCGRCNASFLLKNNKTRATTFCVDIDYPKAIIFYVLKTLQLLWMFKKGFYYWIDWSNGLALEHWNTAHFSWNVPVKNESLKNE